MIGFARAFSLSPLLGVTMIISAVCLAGCADKPTTRPMTARERQDAALKDPFGYSPDKDNADVSGGDTRHFDKDGFKKDVDHVFNP